MLRHAFVDRVRKEDNFTAVFHDFILERETRPLLDHIYVSAALYWNVMGERAVDGRIAHDLWEAAADLSKPGGRERHASDHRPQVAVIEL
jgi:hypothetical protein